MFYLLSFYGWLIVGIILGVIVIGLFSMAELALTYETAFLRLLNLIGLTSSDEIVEEMNEKSDQVASVKAKELGQEQQRIYIGDINWSEYSPQILASITEVRYLFASSINPKTKEIINLRLLNEGMKKTTEFIVKYWFELKDEDRQMFEVVAIKLVYLYRKFLKQGLLRGYLFMTYSIIKRRLHYSIANLLYELGLKKRVPRPIIKFSKEFIQMCFESFKESRTDNLILKFVNNQTIFINTILRLTGKYDLIDESLYFPKALDKIDPFRKAQNLSWEDQIILSSAYIRRQGALFDALPKEQLLPYKGQYVFFEEGEIKDSDINKIALAKRIYAKEGYRDLFLEKVV